MKKADSRVSRQMGERDYERKGPAEWGLYTRKCWCTFSSKINCICLQSWWREVKCSSIFFLFNILFLCYLFGCSWVSVAAFIEIFDLLGGMQNL